MQKGYINKIKYTAYKEKNSKLKMFLLNAEELLVKHFRSFMYFIHKENVHLHLCMHQALLS